MSRTLNVPREAAGTRLDQWLTAQLGASRARVQELLAQGKVRVGGAAAKASLKLRGGEQVEVTGPAERPPIKAVPEEIPLDVVYEDERLAVVNKPAGMMVHAGAAKADDPRNRGTLVNALLHRFGRLAGRGGELRPGIVHRLDKETSGLVVVAKDDATHQALQEQFAARRVEKKYLALVHGWPRAESATIDRPIARDRVRRTRMTARVRGGRAAVSHYRTLQRLETPYGRFALLEVKIDTGRTHQIRVHMATLGHPVAGDTLYGAAARLAPRAKGSAPPLALDRNFLHAAELAFRHPATGRDLRLRAALPAELCDFLEKLGTRGLPAGI